MPFHAHILTLFPEMFPGPLGHSLAGKALEKGLWQLTAHNIRAYAADKHHTVDDTPYGGGAGMVLKPDVLAAALEAAAAQLPPESPKIYLSPRGAPFTQRRAEGYAKAPGLLMLCGRYEGVDQRVIDAYDMEELSLGDYILAGGELAAMVVCEAVTRLLPGVVGQPETHAEESFSSGLLEYPQYTKPPVWDNRPVPDVLRGGNHAAIAAWRRAEAEALTKVRRPDLWAAYTKK